MYEVYVTKIKNIRNHSNADRLNIGYCFGNQVIISKETKEDDIGLYFPTDTQLSMEYCIVNKLLKEKDINGKDIGGYLDSKKRHIRALKLRGEISDGLFMPITSLSTFGDIRKIKEGDNVACFNGHYIANKYIPQSKTAKDSQPKGNITKNIKNSICYKLNQHIDTKQLIYNHHRFNVGDICYLTLKMHGTSGRTGYVLKETTRKNPKVLQWLIGKEKKIQEKVQVTGSRRVNFDKVPQNYRGKYHDFFAPKLHFGETIYYEIVGYGEEGKPIMGSNGNDKMGKDFIQLYGNRTVYDYGCVLGENKAYVYRMTYQRSDGIEVDYPWDYVKSRAEQMCANVVLELDRFIYTTHEDLMERVNLLCEDADPIGKTHIREGLVVRIEGLPVFTAFKYKSIDFKILEGLIKDAGVVDIEEQQEL